MAEYTIGLDLGGTNLRAAAIDRSGKMLESGGGSTPFTEGRQAVLDDMVSVIDALRKSQGAKGLAGIGAGVPGFILLKEGIIKKAANLPCMDDAPVRDVLEQRLGTRVILENDANAAALGEQWMGAGRGVEDLVLLTLGTGIGGGIIMGGKILHGSQGLAGELGHITVVPNGNPCGCGNQGCLEKHASASAVAAMARVLNLGENLTSKDVCQMAMAGNEGAIKIFVIMGQALGVALATLINTFNFPLYLLSGGPLGAWDLFAPAMMEEVRVRSFTFRSTDTRIEKAALGNQAGLYGAACLPWLEA